jgi:ATP-binding protein involved in chromosome partitioning
VSLVTRRRPDEAVDLEAVRRAAGAVPDPELHLSLADAGMLGEVEVDRAGVALVTVRLTTPTCPMRDRLVADVGDAVRTVPGVTDVGVTFGEMGDGERIALASRLRGGRETGHPFGPDSRTAIYAVASGKGGVGKSTVTANLAVALAQQGKRVGVLDADVWGYSVPQLFGVRERPVALKGLMMPVQAHGVALMSVGFLVDDGQPVVWRGPMLHKAIEQFLSDVHWGELDVLLIDLPPGTGDVTLSLLELLPDAQLLAVTTPQVAAEVVATRVGRMALDSRMPIAGVIENMSGGIFGEGGGARLAASIGAPLLGRIGLDVALRTAGDAGVPGVVAAPGSAAVAELRRIADTLPVVRRSLVGRSLPLSVV